ncbi:AbrB/MazE/SpoVT family DNA-binding domain-containing protein [Candidatus Woesearchaeota archaeon]|nr:AbrB/MazE/SpoVT family DNA-binding domain-containing protein [Candidatus Woesearchaeota archaeon]
MEIRTVKISAKRQITIPKSFIEFREGEDALIIARKDEVVIRPMREVNETALLSERALAECWDSPEDEEAFAYLQK